MFQQILGLRQLCALYEVLVFDLWGVFIIRNEINRLLVNFFNQELQKKKTVFFLSNTSRTSDACSHMLGQWGLMNIHPQQVITAGDVARDVMLSIKHPVIYHLNDNMNDESVIKGFHTTTELAHANVLLLSLYEEHPEKLSTFDTILKRAVQFNTTNICANPDVQTIGPKNTMRYNAGYFARRLEDFGGYVHYAGKPHIAIFNKLLDAIRSKNNEDIDLTKIIMIGDTLEHDILGANRAGIHSALVTNGNSCVDCSTLYDISAKIHQSSITPSLLLDVSRL